MDRFRDGSTDWHNWMRDTMKIDPSDSKSIALVWAVISRMKLDAELAARPPEPRTCETCATGCLPNERVYVNPDVETPCPGWTLCSPQSADVEAADRVLAWIKAELGWSLGDPDTGELGPEGIETRNRLASVIGTRPVSAEDVEMVRRALESARGWVPEQTDDNLHQMIGEALAALDRIAGVLR